MIRQELLFEPGQVYDPEIASESERILRARVQLSVVLIVPLKGSRPNTIKLLVVTKDVWSLRMSYQPTIENGKLISFALQPSEINIFGTHHVVAGAISLTPSNYTLGGSYTYPRIGGSHIRATIYANF